MSPDKSPSWSFRGGTLSISQSGDDGRPKSDWKYHHLVKKVAIQGGHAQVGVYMYSSEYLLQCRLGNYCCAVLVEMIGCSTIAAL